MPFLRAFVAILAGLIVSAVVIIAVEWISTMIFPLPEGVDPTDASQMREIMHGMPAAALAMVLVGWFLGVLAGVFTAIRLHPEHARWAGYVVAALFAVATVVNMVQLPHPAWMMVGAPIALGLALFLGVRLAEAGAGSAG